MLYQELINLSARRSGNLSFCIAEDNGDGAWLIVYRGVACWAHNYGAPGHTKGQMADDLRALADIDHDTDGNELADTPDDLEFVYDSTRQQGMYKENGALRFRPNTLCALAMTDNGDTTKPAE